MPYSRGRGREERERERERKVRNTGTEESETESAETCREEEGLGELASGKENSGNRMEGGGTA